MICCQDVCLKEVADYGASFNWKRPQCPCFGLRVWGHGRVARYFEGFREPLLVQRFRCADCRKVFTCRPAAVWPRFLSFALTIIDALIARYAERFWPMGVPRQRGGHWLRRLSKELLAQTQAIEPVPWLQKCRANARWPFSISV